MINICDINYKKIGKFNKRKFYILGVKIKFTMVRGRLFLIYNNESIMSFLWYSAYIL